MFTWFFGAPTTAPDARSASLSSSDPGAGLQGHRLASCHVFRISAGSFLRRPSCGPACGATWHALATVPAHGRS